MAAVAAPFPPAYRDYDKGMAKRVQFTLRNLFWATTLAAIACLVLQFISVGVPYWWNWDQGQATEAKWEELRRLRILESELPLGEERGKVLLRRRELEAQLRGFSE